jgi:hypothetical protein
LQRLIGKLQAFAPGQMYLRLRLYPYTCEYLEARRIEASGDLRLQARMCYSAQIEADYRYQCRPA